jgi:NifB/MoaA-like Fe-S oxidoreductase
MAQDEEMTERFRNRAVELRNIAAHTTDPEDRAIILRAAEACERMADMKWLEAIKSSISRN